MNLDSIEKHLADISIKLKGIILNKTMYKTSFEEVIVNIIESEVYKSWVMQDIDTSCLLLSINKFLNKKQINYLNRLLKIHSNEETNVFIELENLIFCSDLDRLLYKDYEDIVLAISFLIDSFYEYKNNDYGYNETFKFDKDI